MAVERQKALLDAQEDGASPAPPDPASQPASPAAPPWELVQPIVCLPLVAL